MLKETTDSTDDTDEERKTGGKEDDLWEWSSVRLEGASFGLGGKGKRKGRGVAEGRGGDGWLLAWVRGSGVGAGCGSGGVLIGMEHVTSSTGCCSGNASSRHAADQFSGEVAGVFVAGAVRVVRHG